MAAFYQPENEDFCFAVGFGYDAASCCSFPAWGGDTPTPPAQLLIAAVMSNIITPAKANPCRPWLLGWAPRKAAFPCKVRGHEYLMPEEGISFRRMLHELWRAWEGCRAVVFAGPFWGYPDTSEVPQSQTPFLPLPMLCCWMGRLRESALLRLC